MGENSKILYVGLNEKTIRLLLEEKYFNVIAVADLDIFFVWTFNPVNWLFKIIYWLRINRKWSFLERYCLFFWTLLKSFSSSIFNKYKDYLILISKNKLDVIDFNNASGVADYIKSNQVDLIVVNTWGMLSEKIIFSPRLGTVNIHPSKLPQYRGALPTLWTLKNKDKESAVTYIILDKGEDSGKIIGQHIFSVADQDTSLLLENKIDNVIEKTLTEDLKKYISGEIEPIEQDLSLVSKTVKYEEYREIKWKDENVRDIYNKINLYPFVEPGIFCYFFVNKRKINIERAGLSFDTAIVNKINPGEFSLSGRNLLFRAKDGIIKARMFLDISFFGSLALIFNKIL